MFRTNVIQFTRVTVPQVFRTLVFRTTGVSYPGVRVIRSVSVFSSLGLGLGLGLGFIRVRVRVRIGLGG